MASNNIPAAFRGMRLRLFPIGRLILALVIFNAQATATTIVIAQLSGRLVVGAESASTYHGSAVGGKRHGAERHLACLLVSQRFYRI